MKQMSAVITLGIIQVIILSLFGLYFYELKHTPSSNKVSTPVTVENAVTP